MDKPKVLILYNKIFHYRIPIWNILAKRCDLTITYSQGKIPEGIDCEFSIKYLPYSQIGPIIWHKANVKNIAKCFDAVIVYGDIKWIKFSLLPFFCKTKVAIWTIGVSTEGGYDKRPLKDWINRFFYKKAKALIFYSDDPIRKYVRNGFKKESLFIANNTVEVLPTQIPDKKNYLVFIGTLHKRKGINLLLESYYSLREECVLPQLVIVGNGPEYNNIKEWIDNHDMGEIIKLKGTITDPFTKSEILSHAIACISPKQAGLSVLESMGYGVPFITTTDAITGGERFNIHNNVDGVVMESEEQLTGVLRDIVAQPEKYYEMGRNAKDYYNAHRMPEQMADGLWDAIKYIIEK